MPTRPLTTRTNTNPRPAAKKTAASKPKPTASTSTPPPAPTRKEVVADINTASQSLSAVVKAGWKARATAQPATASQHNAVQIKATAGTLRTQLASLRVLSAGAVDVEQASVSVLGKLVQIELFELALDLASDIRPALAALYHPTEPVQPPPPKTPAKSTRQPQPPTYDHAVASLPLPSPQHTPPDSSLLNIIGCYLAHSLTALSHLADATAFAAHVASRGTLLDWHVLFAAQQSNNFMRVPFQCLPKQLANSQAPPPTLFRVRTWTLQCLLKLNELDFEGFWNQAVIFAGLYTKAVTSEDATADACTAISSTFLTLVRAAQNRQDGVAALAAKSFATFIQRWMQFAKKVNNLDTLNYISRLMDTSSLSSGSSQRDTTVSAEKIVAKIGVAALQSVELMERFPASLQDPSLTDSLSRVSSLLSSWNRSTNQHATSPPATELLDRLSRSISKLRRACVDTADMWTGASSDLRTAALTALSSLIETVDTAQTRWNVLKDATNGAIDALTVLARVTVKRSPTDAFSFIERAARMARSRDDGASTLATRLRVLSATSYTHGGSLYKDGGFGHAALFLKTSCELAQLALAAAAGDLSPQWNELRSQLPKRWELHGVCSFKFGDRAMALASYRTALATRGTMDDLAADLKSLPPSAVFAKLEHADLALLLERDAFIASSDLMFSGEEMSLRTAKLPVGEDVLGALLEWQVATLRPSWAKEQVAKAVGILCVHAAECYAPNRRPVRRARVLLRQLEVAYASTAPMDDWQSVVEGIIALLSLENVQDDSGLAAYRTQYIATAYLYGALLAHRFAIHGSDTSVLEHVQHAIASLKDMLGLRHVVARTEDASIPAATKGKAAPARARASKVPTRTTAAAKAAPAAKTAPRAKGKKVEPPPPVTPAPTRRGGKPATRVSVANDSAGSKIALVAVRDDWKQLYGLLQSSAQLLGLLGHTFVRIQVLKLMRHLSAEVSETSEEFIRSSIDLAAEYADLGLIDRSLEVLGRARVALFGEDTEDSDDLLPSALGVELLLLSSRMLAEMNETELSITEFRRAARMCEVLDDSKGGTSAQRIRDRTLQLERTARACAVFASIELSRDNPYSAMGALTQSLRLWNRAVDNIARLAQQPEKKHQRRESNPFDMSDLKDALSEITPGRLAPAIPEPTPSNKMLSKTSVFDGLQWRVAEGLLRSMFSIAKLYLLRGSAREAQFFLKQALELATALDAPAMQARAHARRAELSLQMHENAAAMDALGEAEKLSQFGISIDLADIQRIHGLLAIARQDEPGAVDQFSRASGVLVELGQEFAQFEMQIVSPKKAVGSKAAAKTSTKMSVSPMLLAAILGQQIWLRRDKPDNYDDWVAQLNELLQSIDIKGEHTSLMAKLAVHAAQAQLGSDMFLSSLAESTITIPMRVSPTLSKSTREILGSFGSAEALLLSTLEVTFERGHISQVRDAAVSLATISALQAALGKKAATAGHVAAGLLNLASSMTLERELLDAIQGKMTGAGTIDDLVWPSFTPRGTSQRKVIKPKPVRRQHRALSDSDDDDEEELDEEPSSSSRTLTSYWGAVRERHRPLFSQAWQPKEDVDELPDSWTIVSISVTEDKSMMFVSRQRPRTEPLVFCVPLERQHRREDDEEQLTFSDARAEMAAIIRESNEGAARAKDILDKPKDAKAAWWKTRSELDTRLKQLLDNIEYCWLGAFKTVLNDPLPLSAEDIDALRLKFETVFSRSVRIKDKKQISKLALNPSLVECFLTLDPTCRDEELEDLVYFMLDLYQFNGVPVAAHDVDIDHVIVDLRTLLEESSAKIKAARRQSEDRHLFLVLDKNVQGIPWESIPVLRGRAVSRIPSIAFLMDRLQLSRMLTAATPSQRPRRPVVTDRALVNPSKTTYVINPSGDLKRTEETFTPWLRDMEEEAGWDGIIGRPPTELEMISALSRQDLVIYFGHGGAEQYVRSHKVRNLPRCAATMLWGCSSGAMREMGDFDRAGTPDAYMLSGCPTLVANLWDVTDRDIDRLSESVFKQLRLEPSRAAEWRSERTTGSEVSVVAAVAKAREVCKLKYLTGAAAVVYGIPFYC